RALTLISRRIVTNRWKRMDVESTDVVGISIKIEEKTVRIFNIYNDREHSRSTRALDFYLRSAEEWRQKGRNRADVWVRHFNQHHPM
ncbi:hypothetical protein J132_07932, partial [Termitomyces sp. J132]